MKNAVEVVQQLTEEVEQCYRIIEAVKMALIGGKKGKKRGRKPGSKNKAKPTVEKKQRKPRVKKVAVDTKLNGVEAHTA